MNAKIVAIQVINSEDAEYNGSFLALYDDGALARLQIGYDDKGACVKATPLPLVSE